jgi:hypothetical protein
MTALTDLAAACERHARALGLAVIRALVEMEGK